MSAAAAEVTTDLQTELCFSIDGLIFSLALCSKTPSQDICTSYFSEVGDSEANGMNSAWGKKKKSVIRQKGWWGAEGA